MAKVDKTKKWVICRICLRNSESEMLKIFEENGDGADPNSSLVHKIEEYGGIQLDNASDLPDCICDMCLLLLNAAHKFRVRSQRSQHKLTKLLQLEIPLFAPQFSQVEQPDQEADEEQPDQEEDEEQPDQEADEEQPDQEEDEEEADCSLLSPKPHETNEQAEVIVGETHYAVKLEETTMPESTAGEEALGFVVEEYIELPNEHDQIDFLQDDSTENFNSVDMGFTMHQQFEVVKAEHLTDGSVDDADIISCDEKEDVESILNNYGTEEIPNLASQSPDLSYTEGEYKIVPQFSAASRRTKRQSGKRKSKKTVGINSEQADSYICSHCGNMYTEKAKLTLHLKNHAQEKPHECEICHKRFTQTPQLTRHMNSHTGSRPFKCKYCKSCFADPSTCIKHERIHTNERPYNCEFCGKSFSYSNVLKVHIMMHTGEKPFSCEYCGKRFSQLHHKKAHERTHNQEL